MNKYIIHFTNKNRPNRIIFEESATEVMIYIINKYKTNRFTIKQVKKIGVDNQ